MSSRKNRSISNVQIMQLFHEIKQQFPSISDQVITSCISSQIFSKTKDCSAIQNIPEIIDSLEHLDEDLMGHKSYSESPLVHSKCRPHIDSCAEMPEVSMGDHCQKNLTDQNANSKVEDVSSKQNTNLNDGDISQNTNNSPPKRPTNLAIRPKCFPKILVDSYCAEDNNHLNNCELVKSSTSPCTKSTIHTDLNCNDVKSDLPLTSLTKKVTEITDTNKKEGKKVEENAVVTRKETVETPTQTTDTLLGETGVNFSVNLNYSMDYIAKNHPKYMSQLQVTPFQPWLHQPAPQKNYTSVNLTLRPPSSTPQSPIDITSENARLTYSTSSFDSQQGLESRLQITVGPSGSCVASSRIRPRSCFIAKEKDDVIITKAESLPNLTIQNESIISKQQVRIERLRIELSTEKAKLTILKREVRQLESGSRAVFTLQPNQELEEQLKLEIKHLRFQCEQLASETNKSNSRWRQEQFYQNIYTGQRGPLNLAISVLPQQDYSSTTLLTTNSSKWHCHLCTFLNHPDLNKCEQCDMARIFQGHRATHSC